MIDLKLISLLIKDKIVNEYYADIIVENKVILELKAGEGLAEEPELQIINYLKATELEVGLLLNFGKKASFQKEGIYKLQKKSVIICVIRVPFLPLLPYASVSGSGASIPYPSLYQRST